jgi:cullin 1
MPIHNKFLFLYPHQACGKFVNNNSVTTPNGDNSITSSSPELLAKYCDSLLKKSSKNPEEAELEDNLNQVMCVFKYLTDKDIFQTFYSKMLAKRLIYQLSASDDAESSMISKLKLNCGFEYTNKLQKMFEDMTLSKTLNEQYRQTVIKQTGDIDFSIAALRSNSWPFTQSYTFSLPVELEESVQKFTAFYINLHSGRRLNWLLAISRGEIVANSFKNRYTLQASTIQIAILLQFNEITKITLKQLCENIGIKEENTNQIASVVQILVKVKLLTCTDAVTPLNSTSMLELNTNFKNKKMRININLPLKAEQKVEHEAAHKNIEEDRKMQIQAKIVQIMKMRKKLSHSMLVAELLQRLSSRFKPKIQVIKKCIDMLIEKEYLDRLDGEKDVYLYLS